MPRFPTNMWLIGCVFFLAIAMDCSFAIQAQDKVESPTQPPSIALTLRARELSAKEQYADAIEVGKQALQQAIEDWGKESLPVAVIHYDLATMFVAVGQKAQAIDHLRLSCYLMKKCGDDESLAVLIQSELGDLLGRTGQFKEAARLLQDSVEKTAEIHGEKSVEYLTRINRLGFVFTQEKRYNVAIAIYGRALEVAAKIPDCPPNELALSHNNLGEALLHQGDLPLARVHIEQALEIMPKGKASATLRAAALQNLGYLCRLQHQYGSAIQYYLDALDALEGIVPAGHAKRGRLINNIGAVSMLIGDQDSAQKFLLKGLNILVNSPDRQAWEPANTLSLLAQSYFKQRNLTKAAEAIDAALTIRREYFGPDHPHTAQSMFDAAILATYANKPEVAKQFYADAIRILTKSFGNQHYSVASAHLGIGVFSESQGDNEQAFKHFDNAQHIVNANARLILPGLSRRDQLNFGTVVTQSLQKSLSFAARNASQPNVARSSWEWLINAKALREEATAFQNQLRQIGQRGSSAAGRLGDIRQRLAKIALTNPKADDGTDAAQNMSNDNYGMLLAEEGKLERQIVTESGLRTLDRAWITSGQIKQQLKPKQALVDFFKVEMNFFDTKTLEFRIDSPRYIAWVVSPNTDEPRLFDLGEASTIESAILGVLRQLKSDSQPGAIEKDGGEIIVTKRIHAQLQQIAQLIYHPLVTALGDCEELILSPDADLWLIPWAALPEVNPSQLLIEKRSLRFVNSSRSLLSQVTAEQAAVPTGPAVIVADPDFDAGSIANPTAIHKSSNMKSPQRSASKSLLIPTPGERWLPRFQRLEETSTEALAIEAALARNQQRSIVLMRDKANESNVKKMPAPDLLYLGTHGFIKFTLENQGLSKDDLWLSSSNDLAWGDSESDDPLLTCGLALSGCNTSPGGSADAEDGILTGYEIMGLNLRGTRLVVTAACETGLGQLRAGEGVASLRQAFQLAGAQSVVSTLWQVSDVDTSQLMTAFFEQMCSGQSVTLALRSAQLDRIDQRRRITGAAHPYFWAGVTVTGN